jgi:hypothetical protein
MGKLGHYQKFGVGHTAQKSPPKQNQRGWDTCRVSCISTTLGPWQPVSDKSLESS